MSKLSETMAPALCSSSVPKKKERPFSVLMFSQAIGTSHCYKPFSEALGSCGRLKYHKIDVGEKFLVRKLL